MSDTWEITALHPTSIWRAPDREHGKHSDLPAGAIVHIQAVVRGKFSDGGDGWGWDAGQRGFLDLTDFENAPTEVPSSASSGAWINGVGPVLTADTLLLQPAPDRRQVERWFVERGDQRAKYVSSQISLIVGYYYSLCRPSGVNLLLALAQMDLETGSLTSRWCQVPYCNFAGIGVTPGTGDGVEFGNILVGVEAHVGRLLAYSLAESDPTTEQQRKLIDVALQHRPLSEKVRGKIKTLAGLTSTWATDQRYHEKLVRRARALMEYCNRG